MMSIPVIVFLALLIIPLFGWLWSQSEKYDTEFEKDNWQPAKEIDDGT